MESLQTFNSFFFEDFKPSDQAWNEATFKFLQDLQRQQSETALQTYSQPPQIEREQIEPSVSQPITCESVKKQPSENNYEKNICSYISKKIVQDLINPKSENLVRKLCKKAGCSYDQAVQYYTKRSKEIFGINHLCMMMTPEKQQEVNLKRMFCVFLNWFLRNKYMYYMLRFGKMEEKEKYIEFKNKYMLYLVQVQPLFNRYL